MNRPSSLATYLSSSDAESKSLSLQVSSSVIPPTPPVSKVCGVVYSERKSYPQVLEGDPGH